MTRCKRQYTARNANESRKQIPNAQEFSEEAYKELFVEIDEDESGTIEKPEIEKFVKKLLGII